MMPRMTPVIASPWPPRWGGALIAFSDFNPITSATGPHRAGSKHNIPPAIAMMPSTIAVVARGSLGRIHTGFGGIGTWEKWFGGIAGKGAGGAPAPKSSWHQVSSWPIASSLRSCRAISGSVRSSETKLVRARVQGSRDRLVHQPGCGRVQPFPLPGSVLERSARVGEALGLIGPLVAYAIVGSRAPWT
jgi:hypothetical protein